MRKNCFICLVQMYFSDPVGLGTCWWRWWREFLSVSGQRWCFFADSGLTGDVDDGADSSGAFCSLDFGLANPAAVCPHRWKSKRPICVNEIKQ